VCGRTPFAQDEKDATHIPLFLSINPYSPQSTPFQHVHICIMLEAPHLSAWRMCKFTFMLYRRYVAFSQRYFLIMLHVHNVVRHGVMQSPSSRYNTVMFHFDLSDLESSSVGKLRRSAGSPDCWHASGVLSFIMWPGDLSELQKRRLGSCAFAARVP
jgi:hypothetical protein